jgi:hypothetical protein
LEELRIDVVCLQDPNAKIGTFRCVYCIMDMKQWSQLRSDGKEARAAATERAIDATKIEDQRPVLDVAYDGDGEAAKRRSRNEVAAARNRATALEFQPI